MKIILLHGDDIVKAYERLQKFIAEARKRGWEIINDEIAPTPSLFGKERLIVVRKDVLLSKADLKNLSRCQGTLIVYHEGNIPVNFIRSLPGGTKVEEFKLPKVIWNFLDKPSIKLFHDVIRNEPVEFVFSLLAKRFRDLYWVKISDPAGPTAPAYQPWQIAKLKKQALGFTQEKLAEIIAELAKIDVLSKTSRADLISSLDLLLLTKLE